MPHTPDADPQWRALYDEALLAHAQGNWLKAQTLFGQACTLAPSFGLGHDHLAAAFIETGAWAEALSALTEAQRHGQQTPEVHYRVGLCHIAMGNATQAIVALRRAVAQKPGLTQAYAPLADAQFQMGQFQQAEATSLAQTALMPNLWSAHFALGRARTAQDAWLAAAAAFAAACRIDEAAAPSALGLAVSLTNAEAWNEALAAWDSYIALEPKTPSSTNFSIGLCHMGLGAYAEAERAFARAILADAQDTNAYFSSGTCQYYLEKWPEAVISYRAGLALQPKNANALMGLGMCLAKLTQWAEAKEAFTQALAQEPDHEGITSQLAAASRALRDEAGASAADLTLQQRT